MAASWAYQSYPWDGLVTFDDALERVGVLTDAPLAALHVAGDVIVDADLETDAVRVGGRSCLRNSCNVIDVESRGRGMTIG